MDLREYNERLSKLADAAKQQAAESVIVPAASFLLASIKNRIMNEGKNSAGASIGVYSTKEMYATRDQFVKKGAFKPGGKGGFTGERVVNVSVLKKYNPKLKQFARQPGKAVQKNVPSSMFLEEGYKQLRDIQGRPTDRMNYNYSGDTMASYQLEAKQDRVLLGLTQERAAKIREGLEKKRGKAFYATKDEMEEYKKEVEEVSKEMSIEILSTGDFKTYRDAGPLK